MTETSSGPAGTDGQPVLRICVGLPNSHIQRRSWCLSSLAESLQNTSRRHLCPRSHHQICPLHPSPTGLHAISQAHHTFSFKSPPPAVFPVKTQCLHSLLLRSSRSLCPNAPHQRSPTQLPPKTAPSCHSQAHYPSLVSAVCNTKTHLLIYYLVFPY